MLQRRDITADERPLVGGTSDKSDRAGGLLSVVEGRKIAILPVSGAGIFLREQIEEDLHLLITVAPNARATVFLEVRCAALDLEVLVEPHADITVICLQEGSACVLRQRGKIDENAALRWHNISLGADLTQELRDDVIGTGSTSSVEWTSYVRGTERQQLSAHNVFSAADGRGEIHMRSAAEEQGKATQEGMIEIGLKGTGTETYLTQEVLMLDPTAKVDAIPALEIRTNDVRASHSASVSRITPEDLFYFDARGIETSEARKMYVQGFLSDAIDTLEHEEDRERIRSAIEAKYASK